jgi:hypothetical protein
MKKKVLKENKNQKKVFVFKNKNKYFKNKFLKNT